MADSRDGLIGRLIGSRYRVTDRIGHGGMGEVFRGIDEQLHRAVAIKFLSTSLHTDPDRLARFRNEARTLSSLNHPHIVTMYEIGEVDGTAFIAMELVEGVTLQHRIGSTPLPLHEALEVTAQVARALAAAHEKGIVHRDIKPGNVMIRPDGYVKVLDFGLAVLRSSGEPLQSFVRGGSLETVEETTGGTPAYMSPEQIDGRPLDARSDLFSLGVLLCEAVTGTNPFVQSGLLDTLRAIGRTPAPAIDQMRADVPADVSAVIVRLLQKLPSDRYQSSSELAGDLRKALHGLENVSAAPLNANRSRRRWIAAAAAMAVLTAGGIGAAAYRRAERRHWVREEAVPQILKLVRDERFVPAFRLIQEAQRHLPDDPEVLRTVSTATRVMSIQSSPPAAVVEVQDYLDPTGGWLRVGVTPLTKVRVPGGYLRWKISKNGVGESVTAPLVTDTVEFDLGAAASAPAGMVPVPGGPWTDSMAFLGWLGPYDLPAFYIDKFEVTNRQYQEFVDKGGYAKPDYWKQAFVRDGRPLTWAEAMDAFRDATGRPGPSTWEGGHYAEGRGDWPVAGVSWYEAAAYAEFARKSLPVIAQGYKSAPASADRFVVALSNLSGDVARVGQFNGLGPFGTFDLIGNVREWYWNSAGGALHFALGRQASSYGPEALSSFDRSPLNGFRCVRNAGPIPEPALAPLVMLQRDFAKAKPVGDDVFAAYRAMYGYDKKPLGIELGASVDQTDWTMQRVTINAGYGNDRLPIVLFLPKNTKPPFQAVVFFPSARVNFLKDSSRLGDMDAVDYVIKSGRAVAYPIYQDLYERASNRPALPGPTLGREVLIAWSRDLGRTLDYLEARPDIDRSRLGYLGSSQGSAYGLIVTALEDRLKAAVFLDGGFFQMEDPVSGTDQVDFAPRMTKPVLMLNGRFDATFPYDTAQLPMFHMLGTADADKRHTVFDTPHDVMLRRTDVIREVLAWFDKYLGRVS